MKQLCASYTFTPGAAGVGTVILTGLNLQLEQVLLILNATTQEIIYSPYDTAKGGSRSFGGGNTTITLEASTTGQSGSDRLQILYDDGLTTLSTVEAKKSITRYRNTALSSTKQQIKATAGDIYGWNLINPNTVDVFIKIYDALSADVTVGTTTPILTLCVPAAVSSTVAGLFFQDVGTIPQEICTTGITIACVTGLADSSNTAPSTAIHCSVRYI